MMEADGTFLKVAPRPHHRRGDVLCIQAPGKINLSLGVGSPRSDGFHEIDSIVCRVGMYDTITLTPRSDGETSFSSSGYNAGLDEENLAYIAARKFADRVPCEGFDIHLEKMIPPGSGLGGGSSDAAAVIAGLNETVHPGLDRDNLLSLAAELGSDVPLFLGTPGARITGRGEVLQPVDIHPATFIIHLPGVHCSTAEVYAKFDESPPQNMFRLDAEILQAPASQWRDCLENQLADPALKLAPVLSEKMAAIRNATGIRPHLTGSGSAIFIPCDDDAEAESILASFPEDLRSETVVVQSNPW